jgi:nicotinamidase/pyrazinamidase
MKKALIIVDLLEGFADDGELPIRGARAIAKDLNEIMLPYDEVVSVEDSHPENHISFETWPKHCVVGTKGAELINELNPELITKRIKKGVAVNVDSYSGFLDNDRETETGLNQYLQEKGVKSIDIVGVAAEYCIKATALDGVKFGYDTRVLYRFIGGVEAHHGDMDKAFREMKEAGIKSAWQ